MQIREFFRQDIGRNIETVIKADDQEHILQEVEEYVVTREVARKVAAFFSAYNDYQGANGVWISGFFGSGKSHLLKILSYVLENKEYNGARLGDLFADKIGQDEMLRADVLRATRIPSESILFNIDQQAQITSKAEGDAILSVFYKVFYDHLGYFGAQRHVAEFERWLDGEGAYLEFIEQYEKAGGEHWTSARRKYFVPKVKEAAAQVLGAIFGDEPAKYLDILDTLRRDARLSIEDFCEKVMAYIESKPAGFRLNFFVDEAGQYISDNTRLMLNLQTIAETLATKTRGQSWLLVTSQEDMEKVVGDLNASQQNDFSRIQARFYYKIPLTSANVDEVIEKRLLAKNELAAGLLQAVWERESANLETLLSFSDVGVQFKGFKGKGDFVNKYPFIPYQFDLFQQCIRALSTHNAFQGKHASVGERSMLGVFQEVVKNIGRDGENTIVSFDRLFEGLRSSIRGEIQNAITLAERNLENDFAKRVLKALFLVKYYSNFKATARNVSVLMIDNIKVSLKAHEQRVQEALNVLENQTYIQRNGDLYEFLTDDEKDIEQEIKSTPIDAQQLTHLLDELIFAEVIRDNRIRFADNKQEYDFTKKIDGILLGRERELMVEVITPNHENYGNESFYKAQTMGYNTLLMLALPPDERLMKDARLYLRTDKYVKQNQSATNKDSVKRILFDKGQQNAQRRATLRTLLDKLLAEAAVYLNGSRLEMNPGADGRSKVANAFQSLVRLAYPSLRMLGSAQYTEDTLKNIMRQKQDSLFDGDDNTLVEAESELLNYITRQKQQHERVTLSSLRDYFSQKPYGWYPNAIWCIAARLYKRGKVEMRQESNLLGDAEALGALLNSRAHGNTLLSPQLEFSQHQVRKLREIYSGAFDQPCPASEAREVGAAFRDKAKEELGYIEQLLANAGQYPFLSALQPLRELLGRLAAKDYQYLIAQAADFEDELLDAKEDILQPVKKFWNGEQKKIYDQMRAFLQGDQSNFEYIDGEELSLLRRAYQHPEPYQGAAMRDAKQAMDALKQKVMARIDEERSHAMKAVEAVVRAIEDKDDFGQLDKAGKEQVLRPFEELVQQLQGQRYIANIRQAGERAKGPLLEAQLNLMASLASPAESGGTGEQKPQYIRRASVKAPFAKNELRTEEDVQEYVEALKGELLRHVRENRRVIL